MEKEEFIKKAKALWYTDKIIRDYIDLYEKAQKEGVKMNYEIFLVELPIID